MGGKAALILIIGFSTIMLTIGLNMNSVSTRTIDNSIGHYENEVAREIARSGINLAISNLSRNKSWTPKDSPFSYLGEDNLEIALDNTGGVLLITSIGTFQEKSKLIEVKIDMASFSEYAYFSNMEGNIWWTNLDSVWGPFHTNSQIQVQGQPYFGGPRTSHAGKMKYYKNEETDAPTIIGTYTPGITIDLPTNGVLKMADVASSGGYLFKGAKDVYFEFAGDSVKYKVKESDPYTTVLGKDFAPNGVVYVDKGNLHLKGTVKNRWSIGSSNYIYLDDDIVYSDVPDPMDENDPSNDLLGILAEKSVIITDNVANESDINIHASIYVEKGGFVAEKVNSRPPSGFIHLLGGLIQEKRNLVSKFKVKNGKTIILHGFDKDYLYDKRLLHMVPPYFPSTNTFKILSWLE